MTRAELCDDPEASVSAPLHIPPEPTDEEVAAILAAVQVTTARGSAAPPAVDPHRWRWSGRWWSKPVAARRVRPW